MNRRVLGVAVSAALIATSLLAPSGPVRAAAKGVDLGGTIKAGYGIADNTWHVGASAGQYAEKFYENGGEEYRNYATGGNVDPHNHSLAATNSYGVQSRLTFRAIVVEDAEGDHVAFIKSDNYLAMDALQRRVGQILETSESNITYDEIMHMASHNHFSPMYSTPSIGVWLFQDVMDIRAFEYQARQMAAAILMAEDNLEPARMGATEVNHYFFKGMVARRGIGDDGSPVGYPLDFGDFGLPVIRFDALDDGKPIAALINWGMHPEGLAADNLITAEFLAPLERFVERATGAPLVFGQGDVGSSESGPARPYHPDWPKGVFRQWDNAGHAQVERGGFLLAQDVIRAWNDIGEGNALVPFDDDFDVAAGNAWLPGPLSHPYPSFGNCRTEPIAEGAPGAPTTPTCQRPPTHNRSNQTWELLRAHGHPLPLPEYYAAPAFAGVEENMRLHLQAFKLGEVILMSCACEAQVDLILNLESRTNEATGDMWLGYDWTKRLDCKQNADSTWTCSRKANDSPDGAAHPTAPGSTYLTPVTFPDAAMKRMKAQVYNDAAGWNDTEYIAHANSDPKDPAQIKGNFTHAELSVTDGYTLPIGVGHAGDYNGYTVSYREYMAYDHYRKALTSYGPHTADYMNTVLVELARELNDPDGDHTYDLEGQEELREAADEQRQRIWTDALGQASAELYRQWSESLPDDAGNPAAMTQPKESIKRFDSTTFSWRGGSNAVDNPTAKVQRYDETTNAWVDFAQQDGEVQTMVDFPNGVSGFADTYSGSQEWIWTANFEAFNAFPAGIGSTPEGRYRFLVDGLIRKNGENVPYHLESSEFQVKAWDGLNVQEVRLENDGSVSFTVDATYPLRDLDAAFPYVQHHIKSERGTNDEIMPGDQKTWCDTCSFRPWATSGEVEEVVVTVWRADGTTQQVPAQRGEDGRWYAATDLYAGDRAQVESGAAKDNYGERNAEASETIEGTRERPVQGPEHSALSLTVNGKGSKRVLTATLTELDSGAPIGDREIKFYATESEIFIGTARTSNFGIATLKAPPGYRGDSFTFRAVFEGDLAYLPSWATAAT